MKRPVPPEMATMAKSDEIARDLSMGIAAIVEVVSLKRRVQRAGAAAVFAFISWSSHHLGADFRIQLIGNVGTEIVISGIVDIPEQGRLLKGSGRVDDPLLAPIARSLQDRRTGKGCHRVPQADLGIFAAGTFLASSVKIKEYDNKREICQVNAARSQYL